MERNRLQTLHPSLGGGHWAECQRLRGSHHHKIESTKFNPLIILILAKEVPALEIMIFKIRIPSSHERIRSWVNVPITKV